jgi:hypothetical protein
MKQLFGVANNNIYHVESLLHQYQKAHGKLKVQIVGFGKLPNKEAQVMLLPNVKMLSDNLKVIQKSKAVVLVFDCPVLCDYLKPITLLDVAKRSPSYKYVFKPLEYEDFETHLRRALRVKERVKIDKSYIDVIPKLLGEQLSSVLNPIMTFLYRIRDTDRRQDYHKLIMEWLVSGAPTKDLRKIVMGMGDFKREPKAMTTLIDYFEDEGAANARIALKEAMDAKSAKKPVSFKKLSKKYQIDPYDIRYTLAVLRKFGRYEVVNKEIRELFKVRKEKFKAKKELEEA